MTEPPARLQPTIHWLWRASRIAKYFREGHYWSPVRTLQFTNNPPSPYTDCHHVQILVIFLVVLDVKRLQSNSYCQFCRYSHLNASIIPCATLTEGQETDEHPICFGLKHSKSISISRKQHRPTFILLFPQPPFSC